MERRFEDHQSWKERRDKRIGEEQLAQCQKQLAECTFKPLINKTSDNLARKTAAISFRNGQRPGSAASKADAEDSEDELPSESSPVPIEECTSWASALRSIAGLNVFEDTEEGGQPTAPVVAEFNPCVENRPTSDGGLSSKTHALKSSPGQRAASPKAVAKVTTGRGTVTSRVAESPSAQRQAPKDEAARKGSVEAAEARYRTSQSREASPPVLAKNDLSPNSPPRTDEAPRSARLNNGGAKPKQHEEGKPQWRPPGNAKVKSTSSTRLTNSQSSTETHNAHIIPYCSEFEDVFHFTAQLCR